MSRKQAQVVEFKIEKMENGETVVVAVYKAEDSKSKKKVKCRGKQTKDFNLVGGWQRDPYKGPRC